MMLMVINNGVDLSTWNIKLTFISQLFWQNIFLPHQCWQSFGQAFSILPQNFIAIKMNQI